MHVVNVYSNKKLVTVANSGDSIFMAPLVYNVKRVFLMDSL